jgi:N-methylhydantoinase B
MSTDSLADAIEVRVLWNALNNLVNEQGASLQRVAFSPVVREAGDLACALFDRQARMISQAVTGTPGHTNSLGAAAASILAEYPPEQLEPGDALIVNDPYMTAGQLLDVTVLLPIWRAGEIIAYIGSTIHHTDVGGYGIGAGARDVFEEGLWIPVLKLQKAGQRNEDVWRMILANVRTPDLVTGDLHAQLASAEHAGRQLNRLCDDHGLDDIEAISHEILARSEEAVRESIRQLESGTTTASSELDLVDGTRITIRATVTIDADAGEIEVDFAGSAPASPFGINVARNYTYSYTAFALRSVLNPDIPNNAGSLRPISIRTDPGSILDARSPSACTARHVVGMFLPMPLLKALSSLVPDRVMAEGAAAVWTVQVQGSQADGTPFTTSMFNYAGGMGARAGKPGLDTTAYPTGVAAVPVEVIEQSAPVRFLRKALREGSGGAGAQPGGRGQVVEFTVDTGDGWLLNAVASRLKVPPEGLLGGSAGAGGRFTVNGDPVTTQRKMELAPGDVVMMELPGGGGYGAAERSPSDPGLGQGPDRAADAP